MFAIHILFVLLYLIKRLDLVNLIVILGLLHRCSLNICNIEECISSLRFKDMYIVLMYESGTFQNSYHLLFSLVL